MAQTLILRRGGTGLVPGGSVTLSYTGTHNDYGIVTMAAGRYRLLRFTSSGTLTFNAEQVLKGIQADFCLVGGGHGGYSGWFGGSGRTPGAGGAGGCMGNYHRVRIRSTQAYLTIGAGGAKDAAGGDTTYRDTTYSYPYADIDIDGGASQSGGTGGGGANLTIASICNGGTGDGASKYPFNDSAYSLWAGKPHCAGGGGGALPRSGGTSPGGTGGTNGGSGQTPGNSIVAANGVTYAGALGGNYGGGRGGGSVGSFSYKAENIALSTGKAATYFGAGGGGGTGASFGDSVECPGGVGYQGVIYMRIPA